MYRDIDICWFLGFESWSHNIFRFSNLVWKMENQGIEILKSTLTLLNQCLEMQNTYSYVQMNLLKLANLSKKQMWIWKYLLFIEHWLWEPCFDGSWNFKSLYLADGYRDVLELADSFAAFNQSLKKCPFLSPHLCKIWSTKLVEVCLWSCFWPVKEGKVCGLVMEYAYQVIFVDILIVIL